MQEAASDIWEVLEQCLLFSPFPNVKQVDSLRFPIFIHINIDTAVTQALLSETCLCKELELCFVNRKNQ